MHIFGPHLCVCHMYEYSNMSSYFGLGQLHQVVGISFLHMGAGASVFCGSLDGVDQRNHSEFFAYPVFVAYPIQLAAVADVDVDLDWSPITISDDEL